MGAYDEVIEKCPYCGCDCECDWVDVGVGIQKCGPYYCQECGSSEMHDSDFKRQDVTEEEKYHGWFKGNKKVSNLANTINGIIVDHKTAKFLYEMGILDEKGIDENE